ncbi:alpha/beta-hydrolase [Terfezia boudieri ATCC MYA-4762]|uniref:Alpha/beta-hydrolase n=1 Tax=Terfezia boudieri ATCC MYA-4762 TaxID=1051890 RepID=A0A3N4LEK5_9PEZI|nr:alpha/beta-hydrolase [Terfezia boudieri ATCC MYA-4762]
MSRIPTLTDFPPSISPLVTIVPPPTASSHPPANVLLLLHGLGDKAEPFANLAAALRLPETVCISLRAPCPLPLGLSGFHWADDIHLSHAGTLDPDAGFTKSIGILQQVVENTLVTALGYPRRGIFFVGFGQGGMLALEFAARLRTSTGQDDEYGGVISIGGPLPHSAPSQAVKTPVLLIGSEKGSLVSVESEKRVKSVFSSVRVVRWRGRNKDGMMQNREETSDLMDFLARRLRSWAGVNK